MPLLPAGRREAVAVEVAVVVVVAVDAVEADESEAFLLTLRLFRGDSSTFSKPTLATRRGRVRGGFPFLPSLVEEEEVALDAAKLVS